MQNKMNEYAQRASILTKFLEEQNRRPEPQHSLPTGNDERISPSVTPNFTASPIVQHSDGNSTPPTSGGMPPSYSRSTQEPSQQRAFSTGARPKLLSFRWLDPSETKT